MKTEPLHWQRIAAETGATVLWHATTGSTNDDARVLALEGAAHGTLVIAESQNAGRGRRGAAWMAPPGTSLLCSVVLRPALPPEHWSRLTHACALAVCEALEALPGLPPPQIKWPNDIFLSGKKVCGILVESVLAPRGGFAIAGLGVNLNLTAAGFPNELRTSATSVWLEQGGRPVVREDFAIHLHRRLMAQTARAASDFPALLADCESRSFLTGQRVSLLSAGAERTGLVTGLGPEGELRLRGEDGREELLASADLVRVLP